MENREGTGFAATFVERVVGASGILSGLAGAISALWPTAMANAVPSASVVIILGLVGYFLRARRLAVAAVVLSVVALVLAVAVGQGLLPWTGPTDPITNQSRVVCRSGTASFARSSTRRLEGGPGAGRSGERKGVAPDP